MNVYFKTTTFLRSRYRDNGAVKSWLVSTWGWKRVLPP